MSFFSGVFDRALAYNAPLKNNRGQSDIHTCSNSQAIPVQISSSPESCSQLQALLLSVTSSAQSPSEASVAFHSWLQAVKNVISGALGNSELLQDRRGGGWGSRMLKDIGYTWQTPQVAAIGSCEIAHMPCWTVLCFRSRGPLSCKPAAGHHATGCLG